MLVIGNYNKQLGTNCLTTAEEQTQFASNSFTDSFVLCF
jgi:hypothetical protein